MKVLRHLLVRALIVTLGIGVSAVSALTQNAPPPARSGAILVSVDVSVTGEGGKPVTGLDAGDFVVTVNGRPRLVAYASFVSAVHDPKSYSTNRSEALPAHYVLAFESETVDRTGAPQRLKVDVPGRAGVQVRARSEFTIGATTGTSHEAALSELLKSDTLAPDIGLRLAAFTLRDESSSKLRVLLVSEIDRSANMEAQLALSYVLADESGKVLDTRIDRSLQTEIRQSERVQPYSTTILTDASGPLVLKLAVVDDHGRRGSVEHRFSTSLATVGELQASDLLLGDRRLGGETLLPRIGAEFSSGLVSAYIELYSDVPDALKTATVIFEVAENEQGRALDGAAGRAQPAADRPNRRAIEGSLPVTLLRPGDYVVRAAISAGGRRIGQVLRPLRIGRPAAAGRSGTTTLTMLGHRPAAPVPFASRTEKFERTSVLTPEVIGYFIERMSFTETEPNSAVVLEHARAGRFDEAVRGLTTQTGTLAAAFLSGLDLYSKGQYEPAARRFREALRLDSEFFPAAFYLGSCYAAGGRDDQAIGAWHLSLVTQTEAPFIYTLLADALLRQKNAAQALTVLEEAATQWPEDDEVQVRIGAAFAASGKPAEALLKYEEFLERHPEDHDRLLSGMRILYEARNQRRPVRSSNEDRALFDRWAAAYAAAKGPQQAVVDQWRKSFAR